MNKGTSSLVVLFILSLCMGLLEISLNLQEEVVSESTQTIWGLTFVLLSVLWAYYDSKDADIEKPFEFGFLIYVFWPVALPWYLVKTRGIEGILMFFGLILIWIGPWFAGLVAYSYFS